MSMALMPYYTGSDQMYYRLFYETSADSSLADSYADYQNLLGSEEPGYFLLVTAFSWWLDKDILMSCVNALFGFYLGRGLVSIRASPLVLPILAMNYYFFMLLFSAERLKVSLLFILIAAAHRGAARYAALAGAVLSHVQSVLLIVSSFSSIASAAIAPLLRGRFKINMFWTSAASLLILSVLFSLREHVASKLSLYLFQFGDASFQLIKALAFATVTVLYASGKRAEAFAMQAPIVGAAAVLGGERIVLFSYFVLMYFGLQHKRGLNLAVLLSSTYFMFSGSLFLLDTYVHGNGFYWNIAPIQRLLG